jgi:LmbE family N-acetylglucosaminyl deacetylase
MNQKKILLLVFGLLLIFSSESFSQSFQPPTVLIVIAHPDDESSCAATVYKITHELKGHVDLALITNGEGGYKYSTLAEDYYHLELTDEKIGRANLPRIRRMELNNAGDIIGIRNYFYLDQKDDKYSTDEKDALDTTWNVATIKKKLNGIMMKTKYDYVFCLLPVPETHGHHKAATILTLETVADLPANLKPIVLGVSDSRKDTVPQKFEQYSNYKITAINKKAPLFALDRSVKFGYKGALSYKIIVNWEVAEHKSQGTIQNELYRDDYENFSYFAINDVVGIEITKALFEELKKIPYPVKTY